LAHCRREHSDPFGLRIWALAPRCRKNQVRYCPSRRR
jgi:hypothetical protein